MLDQVYAPEVGSAGSIAEIKLVERSYRDKVPQSYSDNRPIASARNTYGETDVGSYTSNLCGGERSGCLFGDRLALLWARSRAA
ncbi:hypothetical protein FHT72_007120 [Rhizobium sp. BK077]|uniref:hypothetical protein n=1 Tax=unclassified Rhizobium TaxID=2613769 RepID=UPI001611647B|nr:MULTISPECIES: hypothetical protein [unclassified Rhizobium]MBB3303459.1 hypothetical protein [Rhizobium sp. BK112]MBB3372579.1 hypothetical protein [Rhizobium sp. BK077]MBB4183350.1 hypothetical protein [Rhizobium sp. BK109]